MDNLAYLHLVESAESFKVSDQESINQAFGFMDSAAWDEIFNSISSEPDIEPDIEPDNQISNQTTPN